MSPANPLERTNKEVRLLQKDGLPTAQRGLQLGQMAGVPSLRGNDMETESVSEPEKYSPPSCFHMSTLPQQMDILGVSLEDPKFLDMPLVLLLVICTGDEPPWTCGFG